MDILTAGIVQESRKHQTAIAIHIFALAHAGTAATLAQTEFGDEIFLTILTVAMLHTIVSIHGGKWTTKFCAAVLGIAGGTVIGVKGAMLLVKWIPFLGNAANAAASLFTTEFLGWIAYALLSSGRNIDNLTDEQKSDIRKIAEDLKNEESTSRSGRKLYKRMSKDDRRAVDDLLKSIQKNKNEDAPEDIALKIAGILTKYA
ncbi:MAG: hypothetical protein K2P04_02650 [Oscillospiraceae bacterium]|nr:hypothetical protein [Oscillospiraceae bacterium]